MEYPAPLVNAAGYLAVVAAAVHEGAAWLAGRAATLAFQAPTPPGPQAQAGSNALTLGLLGLATLLVNSYFGDRKSRRENDQRFAQAKQEAAEAKAEALQLVARAKAESDRQVREAKEDNDARTAALEAKLDAAHDMIARLVPRVEIAARAIDTTTTAVLKVAENANVDVAVAPKMNGGHGAMDLAGPARMARAPDA